MALLSIEQLPLGFGFHPTDQELINHYLKRKINGRINSDAIAVIPEVNVCKCEPWDLPDKSVIRSEYPEWFFFASRELKYANRDRHNRATEAGYWKATGKDRMIKSRGGGAATAILIGMKKTLVFYRGRAPRGEKTNWIMHEYRTVEPEFESGEQGQFVLCRLFKKLEENNSSTNAHEVGRGGFSHAPTRPSLSDTQHGADASQEFGTLRERRAPESKLHENSQALPVSADNQPVGCHRHVIDEANSSAAYPLKLNESHCTSNMASVVTDHMVAEDVLPQFIGKHCSDISSPLLALGEDFQFHDYFDQGSSMELLQDADGEIESLVESLLNNQVENVSEMLNIQNDFVDGSVPSYQVCPTTTEPPSDPKLCQFSGTVSMVDTEPVLAQEQSLAYGSGFSNTLANEEFNNSDSYRERSAQFNLISQASPWESSHGKRLSPVQFFIPHKFAGDGPVQNLTSTLDDSTTPESPTANGIRIRYREPHLSSNITDGEQGLATRRLRLQLTEVPSPAMDTTSDSNKTDGVVKAETEDGEYSEHQIAEEKEVSGPNLDELFGFSDHDNSTSADITATTETSQESEPSVRSRKKVTDDTGNDLEAKSTHPRTPKHGSASVLGMILPWLFILLLLFVGSWYYFYLLCWTLARMRVKEVNSKDTNSNLAQREMCGRGEVSRQTKESEYG